MIEWHSEVRKVKDLKHWDKNPRTITQEAFEKLKDRIKARGFHDVIKIDLDGTILSGNQRQNALIDLGIEEVNVLVPDRVLTEQEKDEIGLESNRNDGKWDFDILANEFDIEVLKDIGFEEKELGINLIEPTKANGSLAERFIIPPFSVFDARAGYWQERKRDWLKLGIQSEIGRNGNLLGFSELAKMPIKNYAPTTQDAYSQGSLNKIFGESYKTGTSIFDPVLCEIIYKWFIPKNGIILDPFSGGSVRGIVAHKLGFKYIGMDLSKEQVEANRLQAEQILKDEDKPVWIDGDSSTIKDVVKGDDFDFLFSCPPYGDLEVYSDDPNDLSSLPVGDMLIKYRQIIKDSVDKLKNNRFACFVVGDYRDKKTGFYQNFVSETIKAFEDAGAKLYNNIILITAVGTLTIRVANYFKMNRKVGKTHQDILVFYKGNPKEIKDNFEQLDFRIEDLPQEENLETLDNIEGNQ